MIEILNLRKAFGFREVLKGVDLRIHRGLITGLAGPNAGGKTTLIKCVLGLVVPDAGEIRIDGKPLDPAGEFRRMIGYMPQNAQFPENLNLGELLVMLQDLRHEKATRQREVIAALKIEDTVKQPFGQLSGGTKQKVAAVVALMFDSPILICDEPTAGLDPLSRVHFKDLLKAEAAKGKTVLMVSHLMTEIEQLASQVVYLSDGSVAFAGGIDRLRKQTGEVELERAITRLFAIRSGESEKS